MTPLAEILDPTDRARLLARLAKLQALDRLIREAAPAAPRQRCGHWSPIAAQRAAT